MKKIFTALFLLALVVSVASCNTKVTDKAETVGTDSTTVVTDSTTTTVTTDSTTNAVDTVTAK